MNKRASYEREATSYDQKRAFFSAGLNLDQFGPVCFHFNFVSLQSETDGFHKKQLIIYYHHERGGSVSFIPFFYFVSAIVFLPRGATPVRNSFQATGSIVLFFFAFIVYFEINH